jgi:hypothetical protein
MLLMETRFDGKAGKTAEAARRNVFERFEHSIIQGEHHAERLSA